jgi:large subunit ribosomal protein LP2
VLLTHLMMKTKMMQRITNGMQIQLIAEGSTKLASVPSGGAGGAGGAAAAAPAAGGAAPAAEEKEEEEKEESDEDMGFGLFD